jgi:hypothetical protein
MKVTVSSEISLNSHQISAYLGTGAKTPGDISDCAFLEYSIVLPIPTDDTEEYKTPDAGMKYLGRGFAKFLKLLG